MCPYRPIHLKSETVTGKSGPHPGNIAQLYVATLHAKFGNVAPKPHPRFCTFTKALEEVAVRTLAMLPQHCHLICGNVAPDGMATLPLF